MTIERLLNPETPPAGHRVQEPKPINSTARTISGSRALKKDLGHRNWNQTIHHLFERRNDIRSSTYREVSAGSSIELDPAKLGSYTLRLSGNAAINLKRPPRVPPGQGSGRARWWSTRVRVFYAVEATIAWQSNVYGARDVALTPGGEGGGYALEQISSLPGSPGLASTSDVFDLMYDERTGEWFVSWHVRGALTNDPAEKDPDAVDPDPAPGEPSTPGSEPGDPNDPGNPPENDYTDPDTGEPLVPEDMPSRPANLIALHDNAFSYSTNCGHSWSVSAKQVPAGMSDFSALAGEGILAFASGKAFYSTGVSDFYSVSIRKPTESTLAVVNGDFETGDLTGWDIISGTAPLILDTVQPPQQGGRYYLSGDNFEVSQSVIFGSTDEATITATTDVYTALGSTAEFEVRVGNSNGAVFGFGEKYLLPKQRGVLGNMQETRSDDISTWRIYGAKAGITHIEYFNGSGTASYYEPYRERLDLSLLDEDGVVWTGAITRNNPTIGEGTKQQGAAGFELYEFHSKSLREDAEIELEAPSVRPGEKITVVVPAGFKVPLNFVNYSQYDNKGKYWGCDFTGDRNSVDLNYYPASVSTNDAGLVEKVTIPGTDRWHTVSLEIPANVGSPLEVVLRGTGGRVLFDNVRMGLADTEPAGVTAIGSDLDRRQHLLTTERRFFRYENGKAVAIGQVPFSPAIVAAAGDLVAIANTTQIAFSTDGGATFAEREGLTSGVSQIVPLASVFNSQSNSYLRHVVITLEDGSMFSAVSEDPGGDVVITSMPSPGPICKDRSQIRWVHNTSDGAVNASPGGSYNVGVSWTALKNMPASQAAVDRGLEMSDVGRAIGYAKDGKDLFWNDDLTQSWKLGNALAHPILKLVEIR